MRAALASILVLWAAQPLGGCFFTETINERPSADIERLGTDNPVRGSTVDLTANVYDPDGNTTTATWRVVACDESRCDRGVAGEPPISTQPRGDYGVRFEVPTNTNRNPSTPTTYVEVTLVVTDALGASTIPTQRLELPVGNADPTLELQRQGRTFMGNYPVNVPVTIIARKADADDGAVNVMVDEPVLYAPVGASIEDATLTQVGETDDEVSWELVATMPGQWEIEVTARDPFGPTPGEVTEMIAIPVAEDQSPCLSVGEPAFPPTGATIVLEEARRFAVLAVDDDLDVWPEQPNDLYLGVAEFRWYLASPATGGTLTALTGVDGSGLDLDPASYTPGDELELRVEISDREDRPLCDALLDTCEAIPGCFQRQTWHVEVR